MFQLLADIHSYASRPFDIDVQLVNKYRRFYSVTVVNNKSKRILEELHEVNERHLSVLRDELIYKWLIEPLN